MTIPTRMSLQGFIIAATSESYRHQGPQFKTVHPNRGRVSGRIGAQARVPVDRLDPPIRLRLGRRRRALYRGDPGVQIRCSARSRWSFAEPGSVITPRAFLRHIAEITPARSTPRWR
jgi:hypothetical protein